MESGAASVFSENLVLVLFLNEEKSVQNLIALILFFIFSFMILRCTIRINHECEGRIVKSVPRSTVWHHEACRVMTNGDSEGQIFLSYPHSNNGFVFLLTTVFFYF